MVDNAETYTDIVSVEFTTLSAEPSGIAISVSNIGETEATLTITDQTGATTRFGRYLIQKKGETAPTDATGFPQANLTYNWSNNSSTATLSSLEPGTEYVAYAAIAYLVDNAETYTNIVSAEFTTTGTAPVPDTPSTGGDVMALTYTNSAGETVTKNYKDYTQAVADMNALDSNNSNVKLTLLKDLVVALESEHDELHIIDINRSCTLDLAGHTYSVLDQVYKYNSYAIYIYGDLTFILTDSSTDGTGMIDAVAVCPVSIGRNKTTNNIWEGEEVPCDVHFIMTSGTLRSCLFTGNAYTALSQPTFAETVMEGGTIQGNVSCYGKFTLKDGLIECASPKSVFSVMNAAEFTMTGGIIRNTDTETANLDDNEKQAVVIKADAKVTISGGTLESINGPALRLEDRSGSSASQTTITGDARLISQNDTAIRFYVGTASTGEDQAKRHVLTIDGNAILSGNGRVFDIYKSKSATKYTDKLDININGGYFRYGDGILCLPNSSFVTYPKVKVLDVTPAASGTYAGYYTLAEKSALKQYIGTLEWGYQYFDDFNTTLAAAKDVYEAGNSAGTYDDTLWNTFAAAYEAALPIPQNQNANQNEIDYFTNALGSAKNTMISNAESGVDISNLPDGTYSVQIEMWMTSENGVSMSNGAVNHTAKLVMNNGKGELYVDFHLTLVAGAYGSLLNYWIYEGKTPEDARTNMNAHSTDTAYMSEAEYTAYQTVDMSSGAVTPLEGIPTEKPTSKNQVRPATVCITLPYMGSNQNRNKIYSRVSVDMMTENGVGDQNVIMYINYSTLEEVDVHPTLSVNVSRLSMLVGDVQNVSATLISANGYVITDWNSSNENVARVDNNGNVTAVGEGNTTITVTATKDGNESLTKTISVLVAPIGSTPVKVENVTVTGSEETAVLSGNFLTSNGENGITIDADIVTVNAKSSVSGITSSKTVIPQEIAKALSGKTVKIETNTGSVVLDGLIIANIANTEGGAILSIAKAAIPDRSLGFFSSAYDINLVNKKGQSISFGRGKAIISVVLSEPANYAYCIANNQRTERTAVTISENKTSFTVSHFSVWALSPNEYEVGGTSTGFFLENGNYYVEIALWKELSNEASMGNVAFKNNNKALITVKDGKISRVQIASNPVDVDPYHSAIISFKLTDGTKVTIEDTGKVITRPAGKEYDYIKLVSFDLPDSAQPDIKDAVTYVPVEFWVPDTPMDAAVGDTLSARLKFIWSTAEKTNDTTLKSDETTGSDTVSVTIVDQATGIKLDTNSAILDVNAELIVNKLTQGADYDNALTAMDGIQGDWNLYQIKTYVDGIETKPKGSVVLSIPCTEKGLTVYRINSDGSKTVLKGELKDNYYILRTSSLGVFALVIDATGGAGTENNSDANNSNVPNSPQTGVNAPQTGDNSNIVLWLMLMFASAGMLTVLTLTRKRRNVNE